MVLLEKIAVKLHSTFKFSSCYTPENNKSVFIIKGNGQSVPKTLFQEDFIAIGQQVVKSKVKTIILDESITRSIHSLSLQWYCMVWKELMQFHGVTDHVFVITSQREEQNVEQKSRKNFEGLIKNLNDAGIQICANLDEALSKFVN